MNDTYCPYVDKRRHLVKSPLPWMDYLSTQFEYGLLDLLANRNFWDEALNKSSKTQPKTSRDSRSSFLSSHFTFVHVWFLVVVWWFQSENSHPVPKKKSSLHITTASAILISEDRDQITIINLHTGSKICKPF